MVVMRRLAGAVGAGALLTGALLTDAEPLPVTYADPGPKTDGDDCAVDADPTPDWFNQIWGGVAADSGSSSKINVAMGVMEGR